MTNCVTEESLENLAVDLGGGVTLEMVLIPAGEFLMGSSDSDKDARGAEKPQHQVRITKPFYLGKYEVQQEQWEAVMGNNPSTFKGAKNPVEQVSWDDCQEFLDKLNAKTAEQGGKFVLPTGRSGNMHVVGEARLASALATPPGPWENTPGTRTIPNRRRTPWAGRSRTPGACTTCTGTCGSGATTCMTRSITQTLRRTIRKALIRSRRVLRGGSWRIPAGICRSAGCDPACPDTVTPAWASVSPEFRRTSEQSRFLRRVCHHSYLWDAIQDFPEQGVIHLRAVHRSEGTAGETLLFIHRFAALEDEETAEPIEKPCGACDILHANLSVRAQRAYPHRKWFHCPTPV